MSLAVTAAGAKFLGRSIVNIGEDTDNWWDIIDWINNFGFGRACYIVPGTYRAAGTPHQLTTNCTIFGDTGVNIISTMTNTGGTINAVFGADTLNLTATTTTLTGPLTIGSNQVPVTSATNIAIGNIIGIMRADSTYYMQYTVVNKVGNNLTVDRPIFKPFANGDAVKVYTPISVNIYGNGMTVTGTGDRIVNMIATRNCYISGINGVWGTNAEHVFSYDLGGYGNVFEDCEFDGQGLSQAGFALEAQERSAMSRCNARGVTQCALHLNVSVFCDALNCHGSGSGSGILVSGLGSDTTGCFGCTVQGGSYNGNTYGVQISDCSDKTSIQSVSACFNTAVGVLVSDLSSGPTNRTELTGVYVEGNNYGINVRTPTRATNIRSKNNLTNSILLDASTSDLVLADFQLIENVGQPIVVSAGSLTLSGGSLESTKAAFNDLILQSGANTDVVLRDVTGTWANNGVASWPGAFVEMSNVAGAKLHIERCRSLVSLRAGSFGIFTNGATNVVRIGADNNFALASSSAYGGSGQFSVGTVTLNGATPVDYTFADVRSTDPIRLTRKTAGGTPGAAPTYTVTAGTKVSVTGTAADTSVYSIEIG